MSWRERAACADTPKDVFFSDASCEALKVCARCPVQSECLWSTIATEYDEGFGFGVAGGLRSADRRRILSVMGIDEIRRRVA